MANSFGLAVELIYLRIPLMIGLLVTLVEMWSVVVLEVMVILVSWLAIE